MMTAAPTLCPLQCGGEVPGPFWSGWSKWLVSDKLVGKIRISDISKLPKTKAPTFFRVNNVSFSLLEPVIFAGNFLGTI